MGGQVIQSTQPSRITSSTAIRTGPGKLTGIFVASASTGTIAIYDGTGTGDPVIVNTFSVAAATFYQIPAMFNKGLYVAIGGTVDCTVFSET